MKVLQGWNLDETLGKLHRFWWWCLDYAPDGNLEKYSHIVIASAVEVPRETASTFVSNMIKARWIDDSPYLRVHDWWDYAGEFLKGKYRMTPHEWMKIRNLYETGHPEIENGIPTMRMDEWARQVRARDQYTCQLCGFKCTAKSKALHAHHIKPQRYFPSLICVVSNGVALCAKCHKAIQGKEKLYEEQFILLVSQREQESTVQVPGKIPPTNLPTLTDQPTVTNRAKNGAAAPTRRGRKDVVDREDALKALDALTLTDDLQAWALKELGLRIPEDVLQEFKDYWRNQTKLRTDWAAAFKNRVRQLVNLKILLPKEKSVWE